MVWLALMAPADAAGLDYQVIETALGPLEYTVLVPATEGPYPAILSLPPGPQTREMVEAGLAPWQQEMLDAGFLVVSPVAPEGSMLTEKSSYDRIPALLHHVGATYGVEGKWHLLGISNGGRSALVLGPSHPEHFRSVTVFPGAPDPSVSLGPLSTMPVTFAVGKEDVGWLEASQEAAKGLGKAGHLEVVDGGHMAFKDASWKTVHGWITRSPPKQERKKGD